MEAKTPRKKSLRHRGKRRLRLRHREQGQDPREQTGAHTAEEREKEQEGGQKSPTRSGRQRKGRGGGVTGRMLGVRTGTRTGSLPTDRWNRSIGTHPAGSHMPLSHPSRTPGRQQLAHWELGQAWP